MCTKARTQTTSEETFYETLVAYYHANLFKKYMDANKIKTEQVLDSFILIEKGKEDTSKFAFLDTIPIEEREPIVKQIIEWIINFTLDTLDGEQSSKPDRAIKQLNGTLKKAEEQLLKYIKNEIDVDKILVKDDYDYTTTFDTNIIVETIKNIRILVNDLEGGKKRKEFQYFPSHYFYKEKRVLKDDLLAILNNAVRKYGIKSYSIDIKDLVDSIKAYD